MAERDIFTRGKLNEVYFKLGVWSNTNGRHRFVHAPFDRVEIDGETFLTTRTIADINGNSSVALYVVANDDARADGALLNHQWFYSELNPLTMEQHQMGDWQGRKEDWVGMHKLGFI